eukprot:GHRR01027504.1.p3 GENE.GHRR01027504.1~~GHRR01027504.1.p3  ORF type:complete len:114 (+),score=15.26 GHRR01027504.1:812-1153(+)
MAGECFGGQELFSRLLYVAPASCLVTKRSTVLSTSWLPVNCHVPWLTIHVQCVVAGTSTTARELAGISALLLLRRTCANGICNARDCRNDLRGTSAFASHSHNSMFARCCSLC